jgi:hypothetical protein
VQYSHDGGDMGELVRVLPGLFSIRPPNLAELSAERELYFVFYTLSYAIREHQAEVVSHQPVPEWAQAYPDMRWCGAPGPDGKAIAWKIFNASSSLSVAEHARAPVIHELTPEQRKLSIHQLWPHPVIVKALASGWTPERAEELQEVAREAKRGAESHPGKGSPEALRHYLYFRQRSKAEEASIRLRTHGRSVKVRKGADGKHWLALATQAMPTTAEQMNQTCDEIQALAEELGGEYDGWEAAVTRSRT